MSRFHALIDLKAPPRTRVPLRRFVLTFVFMGVTGCASVGPDYIQPQLQVPADWRRLEQSGAAVDKQPLVAECAGWWRQLHDPVLDQLVAEALQASPDLHSAKAAVRLARARGTSAASGYYPDVSGAYSARRSRSSSETGSGATRELFSTGFDATWEIDIFGGVRRGVEAADADLAASVASFQDVQVTLVAEVVSTYTEYRTARIRLGIARDNLSRQQETLQLTQWRAQAGLVTSRDVEQARSSLEQTRAQIPSLEISSAEAEHRLDLLLGLTPGTLHGRLAMDRDLPKVPDRIAVGIPADTLRQRPDVRAAERKLAAETARVGVAEAARYPSFKLSGSIGLEALTMGKLGDGGTWSLLAGVTAPLFNAGRLRSQVEQQDAVREQALAGYEKSVLTALQDVENALVALARTRERTISLASAAEAARSAAQLASHQYRSGLVDFQVVLETERTVLSVEDSLASSRSAGVLAVVSLYKALGGGWSELPATPSTAKDVP